ncbi:unnamed protein product [Candidula unifasciata]|uniref:Uncharacterized protein n=1 Tax=Candidula unifasciata TaxID=100452 RepID=A0A8S3YGZ4_9EUPU|nr:unnamed protein product [Candidula unifasciata]
MFVDILPWWERCTYWILAVSGVAYSVYILFLEGDKYKKSLVNASLSPGWNWLGRDQDLSDTEWYIWRSILKQSILLNAIHILLSQACFYFKASAKLHSCILLICDLTAAYIYFNERVVVLLVTAALVMYVVSLLRRKSLVWVTAVALVSSLNYDIIYQMQVKYLQFLNYEQEFKFNVTSAFVYIRLVSFAIEKIKYTKSQTTPSFVQAQINSKPEEELNSYNTVAENKVKRIADSCKKRKTSVSNTDPSSIRETNPCLLDFDPSLIDLLLYSFYLPTFLDGPIFIYSDFHKQINNSFRSKTFIPNTKDIIKQLIRIAFWALFIEFQLHFLYYSALALHPLMISRLPIWAVAAIGYCQGQFFMVKYLVLYGTAVQLSRFDGLSSIAMPRCISWVYSFTDMWKHFDAGLYSFIKMYIYIPLGGSRAGLLRQIFASGVAFLFIFYWHGAREEIFIWCFGNYLMCIVEAAVAVVKQSIIGTRLISILSPAMCLRLKAITICPVYFASILQVMFFFFQGEVGRIFMARLLTKANWTNLLAELVFFTAGIHNALYIARRYEHKNQKLNRDQYKKVKEHDILSNA